MDCFLVHFVDDFLHLFEVCLTRLSFLPYFVCLLLHLCLSLVPDYGAFQLWVLSEPWCVHPGLALLFCPITRRFSCLRFTCSSCAYHIRAGGRATRPARRSRSGQPFRPGSWCAVSTLTCGWTAQGSRCLDARTHAAQGCILEPSCLFGQVSGPRLVPLQRHL